MKKSRKSERTLNSCMRHGDDHGMEWDANANILGQCAMCKGRVGQQQNRDWLRRLQHCAHAHVFSQSFKSLHTLLGFVLCFVLILCFVSSIVFVSLWSTTQSVSQILAYFTSRKTGPQSCCLYIEARTASSSSGTENLQHSYETWQLRYATHNKAGKTGSSKSSLNFQWSETRIESG